MNRSIVLMCGLLLASPALAQNAPTYSPGNTYSPGYNGGRGDDSITDVGPHNRGLDLSVLAWIPWWYGFGIGADLRLSVPVLQDGFIPSINDEFDIEPSFGLAYTNYGYVGSGYSFIDIAPAVYGIWAFHFSHQLRVYGGLGLGYNIGVFSGSGQVASEVAASYFYWDLVAGVDYKLAESFALRGEIGSQGLKLGVQFYF